MAKSNKSWIKWAVLAAVLVAVVAFFMESGSGRQVFAAKAVKQKIRAWVEDRARTTLPRVYALTMPVSGRIMPIEVKEGQQVKQGQTVAQMDSTALKTALAQAQARLDLNQFNALEQTALEEFMRWIEAMKQMTEAANEMTKASEAQYKFSDWYTKSVTELLDKGASTQEKLLKAEADNAQSRVDAAVNNLVAKSMNTLAVASELGPRYVAEWLKRKSLESDALAQALHKAQTDLQRATISAPVAGVVLKRYVENEQVLSAGAPLLDIGDLSQMQVTADILSQQAGAIHPGQEVAIMGDVFADIPAKGVVERVKPQAFTKVSSLGVEQQRVPVVVDFSQGLLKELAQKQRELGLAYRLRVRIYTDSADNAVVVPRLSLFRNDQGQWQIFTISKGKASLVTVKVGILNDEQAQILEGVKAGDQVIVSPPKDLTAGDSVRTDA